MTTERKNDLLARFRLAEKRFDLAGEWRSTIPRNLTRLLWLRERFLLYVLVRLGLGSFLPKTLQAKTLWGREFVLPSSDLYAVSLYCFRALTGDDVRLAKFLIKNLRGGDVFYDIGANYGYYSMLAQEIIGDGEIHLFEPVPELAGYLRKNFVAGRHGRAFINGKAVSDCVGAASFYESFSKNMSGISTLLPFVANANADSFRKVTVSTISLDEYLKTHRAPTMLKIDVEGAEEKVLSGAARALAGKPIIIMEVWYPPLENSGHVRAIELLLRNGYDAHSIEKDGSLSPDARLLEKLKGSDARMSSGMNDNYAFVHKSETKS